MKTTSLFGPLFAAAFVSAHGYLANLTINGRAYKGNPPGASDNASVIRQVDTISPIKGANNTGLTCGSNSSPAALVANANPGDNITFSWRDIGDIAWIHETGPMLTYMANCGNSSCSDFNITQARWFKIEQVGRKFPGGPWAQADLMAGGVANVTLPQNIAPGNYLIRHEIIALHTGNTLGGAEWYPACAQLKVGGTQTGAPKPNELVSMPGAYKDTDPGIFDPQIFNATAQYIFPGPPIASFVQSKAIDSPALSHPARDIPRRVPPHLRR